MEDVDFEDEEPDGPAWETEDDNDEEEEDGGGTDGMEAQDDSEVTFALHSGEPQASSWLPMKGGGAGGAPPACPALGLGSRRG